MYWVQQKYYNDGKIVQRIWLESECFNMDKTNYEGDKYDEYWDEFKTYEEALAFTKQEV